MKSLIWLTLFLIQPAFAFDYRLVFDQECMYQAPKRNFPCERSDQPITELREISGKWFGVNPGSKNSIELHLVKDDQYILILQNPVYFSGISLIHLMKKTGRFYWTETAYSDIVNDDEALVRIGRFTLNFDRK
ncbi:MAG: hypothetical protein JSS14_02305 [Proteobacteria bacterium]|nr:hypothetical protein [Pseudomonadota bacterium]